MRAQLGSYVVKRAGCDGKRGALLAALSLYHPASSRASGTNSFPFQRIHQVMLVAERDIAAGEEITVNYLDGADEGMSFEERRRHLLRTHNFDIAP